LFPISLFFKPLAAYYKASAKDREDGLTLRKLFTMTIMGFLLLLLIAAICGAIGQALSGYSMGGCLISIIVGFIGAYIGLWMAGEMNLPKFYEINVQGKSFPIVWAIIGSAVLSLVIGLIRRAVSGPRRY
jgi:uncharacterized membrane protein YeaQ/YmgE (transglycosylase-associated protein family)